MSQFEFGFSSRPTAGAGQVPYPSKMGNDRPESLGLEAFIDESMRLARKHGYQATVFGRMRRQYGTIEAIEKLVQSGDVQSGFKRMRELGLLDWAIESAVVKFPTEFTRNALQCAEWRLEQVRKKTRARNHA